MKFIISLVVILCTSLSIYGKESNDTLQDWTSKFSRIVNPVISDDGKWAVVRKRYELSQDTLLVLDAKRTNHIIGNVVLNGDMTFLKNDGLLVYGSNKCEYWNLSKNIRKTYNNVKVAYPIREAGLYAILDKQDNLNVYDLNGNLQISVNEVIGFPATDQKTIYFVKKNHDKYYVQSIVDAKLTAFYQIDKVINQITLSNSGRNLIISEKEKNYLTLTFKSLDGKNSITTPSISIGPNDYYSISEIQNGKAFLITLNQVNKKENKVVDVWYGSDSNLHAKKNGYLTKKYWLCELKNNTVKELPTQRFRTLLSLNNQRYFLAFNERKKFNYITFAPQINDAYIFDVLNNNYIHFSSIGNINSKTPQIICSPNGQFFIVNVNEKIWVLFDLETLSKYIIKKDGLQKPSFFNNNQSILFESLNGLWKFHIKSNKLEEIDIGKGRKTEVVNAIVYKMLPDQNNIVRNIESDKPALIKITDTASNITSYHTWDKGKIKEILAPTSNKIRSLTFKNSSDSFAIIEENFNLPPRLLLKRGNSKILLIYDDINAKTQSFNLKKELISYVTDEQINLKGILYYPVKYDPKKKHPMIVHIYEKQSDDSNEYLTPGFNNPEGIDVRTLIQRGYFVLLPDIHKGKNGAGHSALECVNKALDAVENISGIDSKRIGLIGHSFGGYETNFIATHSDRFAAFISGAGDSDIINSYFSYNYHYPGPHYWQFETGQYKMPEFSKDKDIYLKNSPIHFVEKVNAPMLLWTGMKDENVPWNRTMEFYIGLKRNKKPVIALFYPSGRHTFGPGSQEMRDLNKRILEWWDYFLKDKNEVPWINKEIKMDAL